MKRFMLTLGAALLAVSVAHAADFTDGQKVDRSGRGTSGALVGGWSKADSTGRYLRFDQDGNLYTVDAFRDRDHILTPTSIYSGQIAAGAADSSGVVDLSSYRTVALLIQCGGAPNAWQRFAVNARYNLGGLSDSLSLFTIPVAAYDDSISTYGGATRTTFPAVGALGAGEFAVTIPHTGPATAAATQSLPQGKIVFLTVPEGFVWPASCSFRFRNIGRAAANTPDLRVWVMGVAK